MTCLAGMIAVVTGASRGIGAAVAVEMAAEGATVIINYRSSRTEAEAVVAKIKDAGGNAAAWGADVTQPAQVRSMMDGVCAQFGRVDVLVCNAGILRDGLLAGMSYEDWSDVLNVNLTGAFVAIREVLGGMIARRSGSIVSIASVHATSGGRGHCNYAASKAGLIALTRSLALEVASRGIRVNAVSPGLIETEMTRLLREAAEPELLREIPMRRFGQVQEVAKAVVFLASPQSSYITGTTLHVSGGLEL